jgi:hypothetical protein
MLRMTFGVYMNACISVVSCQSQRQKADGPAAPGKAAGSGQSAAQKKLSKTNTKGMKSIASFFGKK